MKNVYLIFILFFGCFSVFSNPIDSTYAKKIAKNFYCEKSSIGEKKVIDVKSVICEPGSDSPTIYFINFQKGGFVIVAGDDDVFPIIGYNLTGSIDPNIENSPAFNEWIKMSSEEIEYIRKNNIRGSADKKNEWVRITNLYLTGKERDIQEISMTPLLTTTWDQGCYYNDLCPAGSSNCPCNKHWTGCLATAMAQMMKYHNYPEHGSGSHGYTDPGSGNYLFADFGNTTYNWSLMPNNVTSPNTSVATLMLHCGISVDMQYFDCSYGSGAATTYVPDKLIEYFNYLNTASDLFKDHFNITDWENLIRNELDSKRPLLYSGYDENLTGHAWILDGYSGTNYFHFNWGWSGSGNGYYYLNNIIYLYGQQAILGVQPDITFNISTMAVPTAGGTTSGGGTYQSGQWCTVTATPNSGYNFSSWSENSNQVSTNANYSFNVSGNRSLTANFNYGTPSAAGQISGLNTVCSGQTAVTYSVPTIANATLYIWTLPSGATGSSSTNTIIVNYGSSAISGNVTVRGNNSYGDGATSSLAVIVNTLPADAETTNIVPQWSLQNPVPTGDWIHSICFTDVNTGYAVDEGGYIIKTNNGGATWTASWSGAYKGLNAIHFPSTNTGYAVGEDGIILKTTDGGTSWNILNSGSTYGLYSVYFTDVSTGFVVGQAGTILKTTNGGTSWTKTDFYTTTYQHLYSVSFTNANTGYIVGGDGVILKTTNSGSSWAAISHDPTYDLSSVYFTDANTGYAVGRRWVNYHGTVLKTTNGGTTWSIIWTGEYAKLNSVYFTDANTGYAVGDNGDTYGFIMKTTNGGATWAVVGSTNKWLSSVYFTGAGTGFAVGQSGTILKTTNSGSTWTAFSLYNNLNSVFFTDTNTGYAAGQNGSILKTSDGGINWTALSTGTDKFLSSVHFPCIDTGFAVGWNGTVLKTTNGGTSWISNSIGTNLFLTSVYFTTTNTGYAVDDFGTIVKTSDGGLNWITLSSGTYQGFSSVYFTDENTGYAAGSNGIIIKTTNGGSTWNTLTTGTDDWLNSVFFPDANTGYSVGSMGILLKTTNGGTTWTLIDLSSYFYNSYSVHFSDANTGYVTGSYGTIIKTTNGGTSWAISTSGTNNSLTSVYFADDNTGCAVGVGGTILKYNNTVQTIAGNGIVCQGQTGLQYTVPLIEGASSYIWALPGGATGTSTTNSIIVDYSSSAVSGNITVKGHNDCGDGAITSLAIIVNPLPATAGEISGPTIVCQGQNEVTYMVPIIEGAISYIWTLPSGASGTSTTNTIIVDYGSSAISGNVTAAGNNDCGEGVESSLAITVNPLPAQPSEITGPTSPCPGTFQTYSVINVDGVTYTWTVPSDWTITSGQNTASITVTTGSIAGNINIVPSNACGNGSSQTLAVTVSTVPVQPFMPSGPDTVDLVYVSESQYTIVAMEDANYYIWDLTPTNAGFINGNDTLASVIWNSNYLGNATVKVKSVNSCGESAWSQAKQTFVDNTTGIIEKFPCDLSLYPNPVNGNEIVISYCRALEKVEIIDTKGSIIGIYYPSVNSIKIPVNFSSGVYLARITIDNTVETRVFIVN
jgi:photosystem II stability/assembly factor-like uncharacterized protein